MSGVGTTIFGELLVFQACLLVSERVRPDDGGDSLTDVETVALFRLAWKRFGQLGKNWRKDGCTSQAAGAACEQSLGTASRSYC